MAILSGSQQMIVQSFVDYENTDTKAIVRSINMEMPKVIVWIKSKLCIYHVTLLSVLTTMKFL